MQTIANQASLQMFGLNDEADTQGFNIFNGTSLDAEKIKRLRKGKSVAYQSVFDFDKVRELGQYKTGRDGKAFFDYIITPLLDTEKKTIHGYLLQTQDITDRIGIEETLRESEEKYRMLFESNPHPMWVYDLDTLSFLAVNEAAVAKYGYSRDEFFNLSIKDIRPEEDITRLLENISHVSEGIDQAGSWLHRKKDGTIIDVEIISHTLVYEGKQAELVLAFDITERKKAEQELIVAKEKAEESERLKSAFLANMSHEIRTPLNGIMGFAEILKEPGLTEEQKQEYILIIENCGARVLDTVSDIIDFSKIESGQLKISVSEFKVNEKIKAIYNFYLEEAEQKGLKFCYKNDMTESDVIIKTDKDMLGAVLSNLIKNAIKFTSVGSIEFGHVSMAETMRFFVKDTGIGIPADQKEYIFERFRQGSESLNKGFEGNGLGLSISKAYVEKLGGKIWVESELEKGSTFYFEIPFHTNFKR